MHHKLSSQKLFSSKKLQLIPSPLLVHFHLSCSPVAIRDASAVVIGTALSLLQIDREHPVTLSPWSFLPPLWNKNILLAIMRPTSAPANNVVSLFKGRISHMNSPGLHLLHRKHTGRPQKYNLTPSFTYAFDSLLTDHALHPYPC